MSHMRSLPLFAFMLFGFMPAASCRVLDTLKLTKMDDIHIVNPEGVEQEIEDPNNGNSKRLGVAGFKC